MVGIKQYQMAKEQNVARPGRREAAELVLST